MGMSQTTGNFHAIWFRKIVFIEHSMYFWGILHFQADPYSTDFIETNPLLAKAWTSES